MKRIVYFFVEYILKLIAKIQIKFSSRYERIVAREQMKNVVGSNELKLEGRGFILDPENLSVGKHVSLGRNYFIRAIGRIEIGSYTHISRNVVIHTANHNTNGDFLPYDRTEIVAPVKIGRYVWIGMNVCILPGVTIGDGAIIGMGSVISKDVHPGEIVVSSKQRVIGKRDETHTEIKLRNKNFLKNK